MKVSSACPQNCFTFKSHALSAVLPPSDHLLPKGKRKYMGMPRGLRFSLLQPDILRHLPRIVSILNGQAEPKALVRSVFSSIVTTPPQTFGSVSSNLPRVRQSELLTPAELMVLLHQSETEIGLKAAMEGNLVSHSHTFPRPHSIVFPHNHPTTLPLPRFLNSEMRC